MRLHRDVPTATAADVLFELLADGKRLAARLPRAAFDGEAVSGSLPVELGSLTAHLHGRLAHIEVDRPARRVVLKARGADADGHGDAEALVTVLVRPAADGSVLTLDADVRLRGDLARLSHGMTDRLADRLAADLARNLERPDAGDSRAAPEHAAGPGAGRSDLAIRAVAALTGLFALGALLGYPLGRLRGMAR